MDLLPIPNNPTAPVERTRFVCKSRWDGGPFLKFPFRIGRIDMVPDMLRIQFPELASEEPFVYGIQPMFKADAEQIYQTWLFFGLLAEFLSLNELPDGTRLVDEATSALEIKSLYEGCVYCVDGASFLSGLPFLPLRDLMMERLRRLGTNIRERYIYLFKCLEVTNFMIKLNFTFLDRCIASSVLALGELLQVQIHGATVFNKLDLAWEPSKNFFWLPSYDEADDPIKENMLQNGWCKTDITRHRSLYNRFATQYFLSRLGRMSPRLDHRQCSTGTCIAAQTAPGCCMPIHVAAACQCKNAELDVGLVHEVLQGSTTYPVLRLGMGSDCDDISLSVEPYSPDVAYVAISHVWKDGLGNSYENSLPQCQVNRIAGMILDLQKDANDSSGGGQSQSTRSYRLWIDTLCCPVDVAKKELALERIADVYRNATHTLVFDASLSPYAFSTMTPSEAVMRTFGSSTWMRRLWTLQEGALSKSLYFQFADSAAKTADLFIAFFNIVEQDHRYFGLFMDMTIELQSLGVYIGRYPCFDDMQVQTANHAPLYNLQAALYFRAVSVASDEPLCISTLLGLNTKQIVQKRDITERMVEMWRLFSLKFGGIPPYVIFGIHPGLDKKGWRWAPRSLLGSDSDSSKDFERQNLLFRLKHKTEQNGEITNLGLRVRFPGFFIHSQLGSLRKRLNLWSELINPSGKLLLAKSGRSSEYFLIFDTSDSHSLKDWIYKQQVKSGTRGGRTLQDLIVKERCAIIKNNAYGSDLAMTAILAQVSDSEPTDSSEPLIHPIRPLNLSKLDPGEALIAEAARQTIQQIITDDAMAYHMDMAACSDVEYDAAVDGIRKRIVDAMQIRVANDSALAKALGKASLEESNTWNVVSKSGYPVFIEETEDNQVWIVD